MKKILFIALGLFILSGFSIFAQKVTIEGSAFAATDKSPLMYANVVVKTDKDAILASGITDTKGYFQLKNINVSKGSRLEIMYLGYKTFVRQLSGQTADLNLGNIYLEDESKNLDEVKVVQKSQLAVMKGDTLQYNSSAFKTNPDASAEDLVKKMPGIEVSGSSVKAQGEDVKKVTVDGKPFFDQDASLTLKTLPASVIDKIEIFDEQSEQAKFTGFDDGNTSKTMNIVTHSRMRNGTFGRFYAGLGPDGYYQAGGSYNLFEGTRRISLLGMSNNINIQNFTSEDMLGTSSGGGGRGRSGGGGSFGNASGLATTNSIGLNYSDTWGKKISVSGSYFFNNKQNTDLQNIQQNYFSSDSSSKIYDDTQASSSENNNHRFNMRFEYKIDSSNTLLFIPRLSFQGNTSLSTDTAQNMLDEFVQNLSGSNLNSKKSGYNYSNDILFSHSFIKKGRTLSLSLGGGLSNQHGDTWQNSLTEFYGPSAFSDTIDNYIGNKSSSRSFSSRVSWTEPLGSKSAVILNLGNSLNLNSADKQTYNLNALNQEYDYRDTLLSNVFKSSYNSYSAGLGYRLGTEKMTFISTLDYEYSKLNADRVFPVTANVNHDYVSLLPGAMMRIDFNKSNKLRIFYRTNTSSPSVNQLQDVPDYSNPLQVYLGNASLKPSFQQNLFMRYSNTNTGKGSTFFLMFGGGATNNYVANSSFLAVRDTILPGDIKLSRGARLTQPINMDGYRNIRSFLNYGIPVSKIKTNLNFNLSWTYTRIPGMLNGESGYTNNNVSGLGIVLASNISENVDFTVSSFSSYNHSVSSLESKQSSDYFNEKLGLQANIIFLKGFVFSNDLSYQYYSGLSSQFTDNYTLWNMALARKVFKDKSGEFKISIYDLLNQNSSYSRTVTESYIQDTRNSVLGQYFMFTFTYRLRSFKGQQENNERRFDPGMMPSHGDGPPPGMRPGGMHPDGE